MSTPATLNAATRAIDAVVSMLDDVGLSSSRDAGAFFPQPVGILVGLPTLERRGLSSRTFSIPVLVVSGDPLNTPRAVDRVYSLADAAALELGCEAYRPSSWRSSVNAEPLPAVELTVTVTVTEMEG
jgi:hypothetical protein